jgi:protoporphyrin/coproporphyrin ferrochelatase
MKRGPYDAILVMSFGGPEGMDDVAPFLDNVLRGRNVPEDRKQEVAHHYEIFDGVSPINAQNRTLQEALQKELRDHGIDLPVYLGNRNWHPLVTDVLQQMRRNGVRKFLTFVTSGFSCYSGCRQYREDLLKAQQGIGPDAPAFDKIRVYYNHPVFIEITRRHWEEAAAKIPPGRREHAFTVFTAHSIPLAMAKNCDYEVQLLEACRLTAEAAGFSRWKLVYQSRSGPPGQPWLEPDVCDFLRDLKLQQVEDVVVVPIGFISDHMEVLYDLDHEAREYCEEIGLNMVRASTPSTHPLFVSMIRELIQERLDPSVPKRALGSRGPNHDICPPDCCLSGRPDSAPHRAERPSDSAR